MIQVGSPIVWGVSSSGIVWVVTPSNFILSEMVPYDIGRPTSKPSKARILHGLMN